MVDLVTIQEVLARQGETLQQLSIDVSALTQGVMLMNENFDTQGEMLSKMVEAMTKDEPSENPIIDLIHQLIAEQRSANAKLDRIEKRVAAQRYSISEPAQ
jgi:uncharacterized coiled-coil protein SlyX